MADMTVPRKQGSASVVMASNFPEFSKSRLRNNSHYPSGSWNMASILVRKTRTDKTCWLPGHTPFAAVESMR